MRKLLDGGAGTVEDQDEVKCMCVCVCVCVGGGGWGGGCVCAFIPMFHSHGLPSHGTVHSFIREFGGVCSYGRVG